MTEAGRKNDAGKARWDLVPWPALEQVVHVLTHAVTSGTYEADNWIRVPDARRRYWAALQRHLTHWHRGDHVDADSGLPHLAHAACCALFLLALDMGIESSEPSRRDTDVPPPLSDEWDPSGDEPPPVKLPEGMRWQRGRANYWTVEGVEGVLVGLVLRAYDEQSWLSRVCFGADANHPSAIEACQAVATQLATRHEKHVPFDEWAEARNRESETATHPCDHWWYEECECKGACSCHWKQRDVGAPQPPPPPPSDDWDPAGEDPPPVDLPNGLRWKRDPDAWNVLDERQDVVVGYASPAVKSSEQSSKWFFNVLLKGGGESRTLGSALKACQFLSKTLLILWRSPVWDPAGEEPPPVELPDGMRWERDEGDVDPDWDVWRGNRRLGYVTSYPQWRVEAGVGPPVTCATVLDGCRDLAARLSIAVTLGEPWVVE